VRKIIGPAETNLVNRAIKLISSHRILPQDHARKETFFNHLLFRHVAQTIRQATNKDIHSVGLMSETFRPEFFVKGSKRFPLFCVECKKFQARLRSQYSRKALANLSCIQPTIDACSWFFTTSLKARVLVDSSKGRDALRGNSLIPCGSGIKLW
jgi:hypothetical protein